MAAEDSAAKALASKGSKLHTHEMHIRRGTKGGYIVRHDLADQNGMPPSDGQSASAEYPIANAADLGAHVDEHMAPMQQEEPPAAQGA
jgi:hypothetical protein